MTFQKIIPELLNDKAIRRKCWEEKECIFINRVGSITNKLKEGYLLDYVIDDTDLKANDWEVYDNRKYFDFDTAYILLLEGKCLSRKCWDDKNIYIVMKNFKLFDNDGMIIKPINSLLNAKDWYLVEEE